MDQTKRIAYLITMDNPFWIELDVPLKNGVIPKDIDSIIALTAIDKIRKFVQEAKDEDFQLYYHDIDKNEGD